MAKFSVVRESEAPRANRQSGRLAVRMREYERYVAGVGAGRVGKLVPADGETPRSVALRIGRAAERSGNPVDTWIVQGVVYFAKSKRPEK
jgi:hypothetical protein